MYKNKITKKSKKMLKDLSKIGPFVDGSLTTVDRICGNPNCQCRKDPKKKHPAMFLTWKKEKKTQSLYIPVSFHEDIMAWCKNYKTLKKKLKKISDYHKGLIKKMAG